MAPGLGGAVLGVWSVRLAVRALREARNGEVLAAELAQAVSDAEGQQFRQLLGGDQQALNGTIDLVFTLAAVSGMAETDRQGRLQEIAEFYRALRPGRMVITGAAGPDPGGGDAGTGKTVLAIALILGMARSRAAGEPVPVRLSAAAWPGTPLPDWLITHLVGAYRLPRHEAETLVRSRLVLPVLDGLDIVAQIREPAVVWRCLAVLARHLYTNTTTPRLILEADSQVGPVLGPPRQVTRRSTTTPNAGSRPAGSGRRLSWSRLPRPAPDRSPGRRARGAGSRIR
ncbi:hypothetical protein [Streptomyces sp. NPDC047079]|uniref:hypothetical protein n=1 Tax=Streptomyces sp. NPDC047079 TaxID=3154607 RepID=UPI0033E69213